MRTRGEHFALHQQHDLVVVLDGRNLLRHGDERDARVVRLDVLEDFALGRRVDTTTERKILENVERNYPGITLLSVTQKIAPVEDYHQIVLLMEGEILAAGTHDQLLKSSPEYVQIYESQRSTRHYESVHAE